MPHGLLVHPCQGYGSFPPYHLQRGNQGRAESEMEGSVRNSSELQRVWTRAGFLAASICIRWHDSFLNAAHMPSEIQSKQLASTAFFLEIKCFHTQNIPE